MTDPSRFTPDWPSTNVIFLADPLLKSERSGQVKKGLIFLGGSGFFTSTLQISFPKPGKCSHGGRFDQSSSQPPRGGINKDSTSPGFSPHHMLHLQAAKLALLASIQALSLLRNRLGDRGFSR